MHVFWEFERMQGDKKVSSLKKQLSDLSAKYQTESRHWYQEYAWLAGDLAGALGKRAKEGNPVPYSG